ncbi:MAG: PA0069 family radical SAM protein [Saprospiraceae bacterium]|nr:PA0069 family radical SAM protein [Saprospiraceae bacterium]
MDKRKRIKGRGTQSLTNNRFESLERFRLDGEDQDASLEVPTTCTPVYPKTLINKVDSPDVPYEWSINPYQGCEHGCIYCYARNSHEFWGYNPGIDFETRILVKEDAPRLLRKELAKKSWKVSPIMLSGNTDPYQPAEKKYRLTRQLLEIFMEKRHPVGLITKNYMITRDLDLIGQLAKDNLTSVALSINYSDDEVRRKVEPRASSVQSRFKALKKLAESGVRVTVLVSPVIPGINDDQIKDVIEKSAELGAADIRMLVVRLNGAIGMLFEEWLHSHYPERAEKVLNRIRSLHGGTLNDSRWGKRMKGEGKWSDILHQQFKLHKRRFFPDIQPFEWNLEAFNPQLKLF